MKTNKYDESKCCVVSVDDIDRGERMVWPNCRLRAPTCASLILKPHHVLLILFQSYLVLVPSRFVSIFDTSPSPHFIFLSYPFFFFFFFITILSYPLITTITIIPQVNECCTHFVNMYLYKINILMTIKYKVSK